MKEFEAGRKLRTASGGELTVLEKLGQGGQGIVYKVSYKGDELALKWYFPEKLKDPAKFYENLQANVDKGAPTGNFLWPLELTERCEGSFGYLMELRRPEYEDFSRLLLNRVQFASMEAMLNAALCIIGGFRALHTSGYSYQDLNDGNFFFNPQTGDVMICDNDNVSPYGESLGIAGKCRYMAPEVVRSEKLPDVHTDRFSLAVVLYLLLFRGHPLEGKRALYPCLTEEMEKKIYGEKPLFVWDKDDTSNQPVKGVHANEIMLWPLFPQFIKDAFQRTFSQAALVGQDVNTERVGEREWQILFTKLRDCLVRCPHCKRETFLDPDAPSGKCIACHRPIPVPMVLKVKKYAVPLLPGKKLYQCHVLYDSDDYREALGEVISARDNAAILGLRNGSDTLWTATLPNGQSREFAKGKVIRLGKGLKIDFGNGNVAEVC